MILSVFLYCAQARVSLPRIIFIMNCGSELIFKVGSLTLMNNCASLNFPSSISLFSRIKYKSRSFMEFRSTGISEIKTAVNKSLIKGFELSEMPSIFFEISSISDQDQ